MSALARLNAALARAALWLAGIGLVLMMAVIVWQVFARFVLNDSPSWSEPLALLTMLWFILLAAAVGVREGFHLGVGWLVDRLPPAPRRALLASTSALTALFGLLMAAGGLTLMQAMAGHVMPALGLSRAVAYAPLVATGILMALFAAERALLDARGLAPASDGTRALEEARAGA